MAYEHVFDELQIEADPFALCELHGVCDLGIGNANAATLHYILSGEGEISIRDHHRTPLGAGTLVLVPALQSHRLCSTGKQTAALPDCKPAELKLAHLMQGEAVSEVIQSRLVALCAHVTIGLRGAADVIDLIREPIVERITGCPSMQPLIGALLRELSAPRLGSRAMIRAILLQATIEMLRKRLTAHASDMSWMAALRDPQLWAALRSMLDAPGEPHSVETLAQAAGMSRSTFAKRFADAYGAGPMELLRMLRMRRAGALLQTTDLPVKRIAHMVGFTSRSAFSRQFEAMTGQSPRAFRNDNTKN